MNDGISRFLKVARASTTIDEIPVGASGVHESIFRSYVLLDLAGQWIREGVPGLVVLDLLFEASVVADEIRHWERSCDLLTKENDRLRQKQNE